MQKDWNLQGKFVLNEIEVCSGCNENKDCNQKINILNYLNMSNKLNEVINAAVKFKNIIYDN